MVKSIYCYSYNTFMALNIHFINDKTTRNSFFCYYFVRVLPSYGGKQYKIYSFII